MKQVLSLIHFSLSLSFAEMDGHSDLRAVNWLSVQFIERAVNTDARVVMKRRLKWAVNEICYFSPFESHPVNEREKSSLHPSVVSWHPDSVFFVCVRSVLFVVNSPVIYNMYAF